MKRSTLALVALASAGCVSSPERIYVGDKFTADQIYDRRIEFSKKIVRADFVWHYGFEKCHAYVPAEGGGFRFVAIDFDVRKVAAASPEAWDVVQQMRREFRATMLEAVINDGTLGDVSEFTMHVDADVEVILPDHEFRSDVIVIGRNLTLKVIAIHSIHESVWEATAVEHRLPDLSQP